MEVISTFLKQSFKVKAENKRKELLIYDVQSNQCENSNQSVERKVERKTYNHKVYTE